MTRSTVKKLLCVLGLILGFGGFNKSFARNFTTDEKLSDFSQLLNSVRTVYAPLDYKISTQGLDLNRLENKYTDKIKETQTNGQFYYLLNQFISEFHDGHFNGFLTSNYRADIPMEADLIEGKIVITSINRTDLPESDFKFQIGDEIVSINGTPVFDIVNELKSYLGSGNPKTELRTAAQVLFARGGRRLPVPKGSIDLVVRGANLELSTHKLEWKVTGTAFDEEMRQGKASSRETYDNLSLRPLWSSLFTKDQMERSYRCSGTTRIQIPEGATKIIESPFVAYYHSTDFGNIGYLRIPHYNWTEADGGPEVVFAKYRYAVSELEKNTVGLVIDQDHNCGGSVKFLHDMVSLLITEAVPTMRFELLATKKEYLGFKTWLDEVPESTLEHFALKRVLELVRSSWQQDLKLTPKTSIDGQESIYPNEVRYSKPILILIDELSGSGGDAFPSLMGGIGRAKLLGQTTMGLGGHVESQPGLNISGFGYRMTKSLFYRPDGVPVENNGAVPDIEYSTTIRDLLNKYVDYQSFYLSELRKMIEDNQQNLPKP